MERMGRVVKDLVKHRPHSELIKRRCCKLNIRFGIKNLQARRFLSRSLRWESAAEDQTGEQYSKQGRIKELKHLNKTSWSPRILKDFLSRPIFWATEEEMERMCLSKVNLLSNITPRILKNSQEFREVLPTKRSGWGGNTVLDLLTVILWVLLGFSLMPHKLHYVLILLRPLLRDSVTSDLIFGDGIRAKRVASSAYDTSIFSNPNHTQCEVYAILM